MQAHVLHAHIPRCMHMHTDTLHVARRMKEGEKGEESEELGQEHDSQQYYSFRQSSWNAMHLHLLLPATPSLPVTYEQQSSVSLAYRVTHSTTSTRVSNCKHACAYVFTPTRACGKGPSLQGEMGQMRSRHM